MDVVTDDNSKAQERVNNVFKDKNIDFNLTKKKFNNKIKLHYEVEVTEGTNIDKLTDEVQDKEHKIIKEITWSTLAT